MKPNTVVTEHPTGTVAVVGAAAVMLLEKFSSVDFTSGETALLLGAAAAIASAFTPRFRKT